jgi:hypothetical protein
MFAGAAPGQGSIATRVLVGPLLLIVLASCQASPTMAERIAESYQPTIRPGETFKFPSEHHLTLSGEYGLPPGMYRVEFTCAGEVDYRIDDREGRRNGKCLTTGVSNSVTEWNVAGPGALGIAIVRGDVDVKVR